MRLKRHYSIVAHGPDTVELRYGVWNPTSITLTDETGSGHLLGILNRLDGRLSVEEIASAEGIPPSSVASLLDKLSELNALEDHSTHALDHYLDQISPNLRVHERTPDPPPRQAVVLGDRELSEQIARILDSSALHEQYRVHRADPAFRSLLLPCGTSWLADSLEFAEGIRPFAEWADKLVVFGVTTVNPIELRAFNRISLHYRIPWIHAAVDGPFLLVGPAFLPFRSACFECLETRLFMNMRDGAGYQRYKRSLAEGRIVGAAAPLDAILAAMLASFTAFEAVNFLLTGAAFTIGKMLSIYLPTMELTFQEVLRVPGCPACSPSSVADDRELYFDVRTLTPSDGAPPANGKSE